MTRNDFKKLNTRLAVRAALVAFACLAPLAASAHEPPRIVEVAPGVHLFMTAPYAELGLDGNSIAVITGEGVLVFDSNGTPAAAEAVLAGIRKLTDKPVRYVVNSHWHWDHWYGTEVYRKAFPDVTVVAHEATRRLMAGPAIEFNRPGIESELPGYLDSLEKRVNEGKGQTPPPANLDAMQRSLTTGRFFLEQKKNAHLVLPNLTFEKSLTLHLGEREIRILNFGRAVTPGDAVMYLPKEGIVATGDLVVNPLPFALGVYPSGWIQALDDIAALRASILIPGHGEPLRDNARLDATREVFREILRQGREARARGLDADQAKAAILPSLAALRTRLTADDARQNQLFAVYVVDWFLHRVYDELAGPLSDAITPPPH